VKYAIYDEPSRSKVTRVLMKLNLEKKWMVEVKPYRHTRSTAQNSYHWAVSMNILAGETGHTPQEMHDFLLGEAFGTEEYDVMGNTHTRPLKSSTELDTMQFSAWDEWIRAWAMTELGCLIPEPNEVIT